MLGNRNAGAGHDECGASRDIVGTLGVAARAARVDGTFGALTLTALARIARAAPAISSMVSPRTRMPIRRDADLCIGRGT